jgi:hypothetical protein
MSSNSKARRADQAPDKSGPWAVFAPIQVLYHFTPPRCLPVIFRTGGLVPRAEPPHDLMSGGVPVIWLTSDPLGNILRPRDIRHFRKLGLIELLEEIESGRREFVFGEDRAGGSARITVRLPRHARRDGALVKYSTFIRREAGAASWRQLRTRLTSHADNWWLCLAAIPTGLFDAVHPVGDASPGYVASVKKIQKAERRARRTAEVRS